MITLEKDNQVYTVSEDTALYRQLKDNGFKPVREVETEDQEEKPDEVEETTETEKPKTKKSTTKDKGAD